MLSVVGDTAQVRLCAQDPQRCTAKLQLLPLIDAMLRFDSQKRQYLQLGGTALMMLRAQGLSGTGLLPAALRLCLGGCAPHCTSLLPYAVPAVPCQQCPCIPFGSSEVHLPSSSQIKVSVYIVLGVHSAPCLQFLPFSATSQPG